MSDDNFQHDIPEEYTSQQFDFGFTAADENELGSLLGADAETASVDEILDIQNKLSQILQMHSTCEGTNAVKEEYEHLMKDARNRKDCNSSSYQSSQEQAKRLSFLARRTA